MWRLRHLGRVLVLSLTDADVRRARVRILAGSIAERGWWATLIMVLGGRRDGDFLR